MINDLTLREFARTAEQKHNINTKSSFLKWFRDIGNSASQKRLYKAWIERESDNNSDTHHTVHIEAPVSHNLITEHYLSNEEENSTSASCHNLHKLFNNMKRFTFPFETKEIPKNGIYILFEEGESAHNTDRIVRVGTHNKDNNLHQRLKQHFMSKNKDSSIFRKNIGRAILNKTNDPFLEQWNWDISKKENKAKYLPDIEKLKEIENQVSKIIKSNFSFIVFEVETEQERLELEAKIISTVSLCKECEASKEWLGSSSSEHKIRESSLWLKQGLYGTPLMELEYKIVKQYCQQ